MKNELNELKKQLKAIPIVKPSPFHTEYVLRSELMKIIDGDK